MATARVAIVGAGMAGLAAARRLALAGTQASVHEANGKVGGCCGTTRIGGFTFDDGALFVALPVLLDRLFERLALDRAALVPLQRVALAQRTSTAAGTVTFGDGITVEGDATATTQANGELERFLRKWDPVLPIFTDDILLRPLSPLRVLARTWRHLPLFTGNAADAIRKSFSHEAVRTAAAGALLYNGVPSSRAPAASLLAVAAMFRQGYFIPEGGMGRIPDALAQAARESGAEIRVASEVTRILVEDGRVRGIETRDAGRVEAEAVISTASAMRTFSSLVAEGQVPARMKRRVARARLSHRAVCVQLGLSHRIDVAAYSNYVLPPLEREREALEADPARLRWPVYMVPSIAAPELAPAGGSVVEMFSPVPENEPNGRWDERRKEEIASQAIARLRELHHVEIAVKRVRSPRDFENELGLYAGALYGLSPAAGPAALFPHRTPIRGLYLAGQTTWPGFGVSPSGLSGVLAAEAVLQDFFGAQIER